MRIISFFLFTIILVFTFSCQQERTEPKVNIYGYFSKTIKEDLKIPDIISGKHIWAYTFDSIFLIDNFDYKIRELPLNQVESVQILRVYPINASYAWVAMVARPKLGTDLGLYITDTKGNFRKIAHDMPARTFEYSLSENKKIGVYFIKDSTRNISLNLFDVDGVKRNIELELEKNERIRRTHIRNDTSIFIITEEAKRPSLRAMNIIMVYKNKICKKSNDPGYFNYGLTPNGYINLSTGSMGYDGLCILNSEGELKKILDGCDIFDIQISSSRQGLWVNFKDKVDNKERICFLDKEGSEYRIETKFDENFRFYEIKPSSTNSNIAWISAENKLYHVSFKNSTFSIKEIQTNFKGTYSLQFCNDSIVFIDEYLKKGQNLFIVNAFDNSIQKIISSKKLSYSAFNKKLSLVTTANNDSYILNQYENIKNGVPIFKGSSEVIAKSCSINEYIALDTDIGKFHLKPIKDTLILLLSKNTIFFDEHLEITSEFPYIFNWEASNRKLNLKIYDKDRKLAGTNTKELPDTKPKVYMCHMPFRWFKDKSIEWGEPYKFELSYTDANNSNVKIIWENVVFKAPPWHNKEVKTTILFVVILILIILSQKLKIALPKFSKWFPLALLGTNALGGVIHELTIPILENHLDIELFILYLILGFLLSLPMGLISPKLYRSIIKIAPFHKLGPLISSIPQFKKRLFKGYILQLQKQLNDERGETSNEKYASIPAKFIFNKEATLEENPVQKTLESLAHIENERAPHIMIVAPGGQGKSALIREILFRYLILFLEQPSLPIPIYVNAIGKKYEGVNEIIEEELGKYMVSNEFLDTELQTGKYLIIIDGLSESYIESKLIGGFVREVNEYGSNSPILVTMRPNLSYEVEMSKSSNLIKIIPQKLTDLTINLFEKAYLGENKQLPENLRKICRTEDGYYQPVFVRLAIIVEQENIKDITELYESAIRKLVKKKEGFDEILIKLNELCLQTYGNNGLREIVINNTNKNDIELLCKSGLLLPIEPTNLLGNSAKRYKFFHDSIQTYLTVACYIEQNVEDIAELFFEFASSKKFKKDQANILFEHGSEIFQIGILMFSKYGHKLDSIFKEKIKNWFNEFENYIGTVDILNSLPKDINIHEQKGKGLRYYFEQSINLTENKLLQISEYFHNFSNSIPVFIKRREEEKKKLIKKDHK